MEEKEEKNNSAENQENTENQEIQENQENKENQEIQENTQNQENQANQENNENKDKKEEKEKQQDEEISREELVKLLKEKNKEVKVANTKLGKLEKKYVMIFKENKKHNLERENFIKFGQLVLGQENQSEYNKIIKTELGEIQFEQLSKLFFQHQQQSEKAMNKVIEDINTEKIQNEQNFQQKIKTLEAQKGKQSTNQLSKLNEQLEEIQKNNKKLSQEVLELNQVIQEKERNIKYLEQQEDQRKKQETDVLLSELQLHNQKSNQFLNVQKRIQESEYKNKILQLQNKLEQASDEIKQLKSQNNDIILHQQEQEQSQTQQTNTVNNIKIQNGQTKQPQQFNSETQTDSVFDPVTGQYVDRFTYQNEQFNKVYGMQLDQQQQFQKLREIEHQKQILIHQQHQLEQQISANSTPNSTKNSKNLNKISSFSLNNNQNSQSTQNLYQQQQQFSNNSNENQQQEIETHEQLKKLQLKENYLKNVVLKYFEYLETKQNQEAAVCQHSIMNILNISPEERAKIEEAKKQGSLWNSTLSYIPFLNNINKQNSTNIDHSKNENLFTQ